MKILLSQLSFKANIKFCTQEEFERNKPANFTSEYPTDYDMFFKTQQEYLENHPNEASWPWNIQSIRNEHDLTTGKIFTCSAGGITGVNNNSMAARYHFVPEQPNINTLSSDVSSISLKRRNIDPSYFWGQDSNKDKRGVDAYYTAKDDTWRILKYKPNSNQVVCSIEDLKESFTKMHLGKNDKLYFKDAKRPIVAFHFNSILNFKGRNLEKTA